MDRDSKFDHYSITILKRIDEQYKKINVEDSKSGKHVIIKGRGEKDCNIMLQIADTLNSPITYNIPLVYREYFNSMYWYGYSTPTEIKHCELSFYKPAPKNV